MQIDDAPAQTYEYDESGNRRDANSQYDAQDRLTKRGNTSYAYNASGHLSTQTQGSDTHSFHYDSIGQIRKVELNGHVIDYVVAPDGQRLAKKRDGDLVAGYLYDASARLIGEVDASGKLAKEFLYGSKQHVPDFMVMNGTALQIVSDSRGSPRLVINTVTGEIVQRMDYDAWVFFSADTNPGLHPFGFAGGVWDKETGLVRFGARDYDPELGRWTAKDPILFAGGQTNLYAYVNNDPVNRVDPTGLMWVGGSGAPRSGRRSRISTMTSRSGSANCTRIHKVSPRLARVLPQAQPE